jgi:hypothetical protein
MSRNPNPETLEALACLETLALAEDCGIRKMLVASDCLNVVKNIKELPRCSYTMILRDIFQRSKSCRYARFIHEGREYNREAHCLAKYACTLGESRHVWFGSPLVFLDVNFKC